MKVRYWAVVLTAVLAFSFSTEIADCKVTNNLENSEVRCMTEALYFEARNQPENGIRAVAHVIKNRTDLGEPKTICEVVHEKHDGSCQFSYYCMHNKSVADMDTYTRIKQIARSVLYSQDYDFTDGSQYYHALSVHPRWKNMKKTLVIANHVFYKADV